MKKVFLGSQKDLFFSWIQLREREYVKAGDLVAAFGMSPKQERELLSRLSRAGQIVRLSRALYLVPKKLPPGGKWRPHEYLILAKLMECLETDYQISGLTAFNRHGLSEQVPNDVFVYNTLISGTRKIAGLSYHFAKVPSRRLGGATDLQLPSGEKVKIATLARTIVDAIYDWERFNTLPKAYGWLTERRHDLEVLTEVADLAVRFGNIGTIRRIGYIFSIIDTPASLRKRLKAELPVASQVAIPLVPGIPAKGKRSSEWGIIDNLEKEKLSRVSKTA